jgi:hypothetical protein
MRAWKSSESSNTTARPVCCIKAGVAALGLMTALLGARLPRSTAMPALALKGSAMVLMTAGLWLTASSIFSRTLRPVAVTWSRCSTEAISFITAGRPPA